MINNAGVNRVILMGEIYESPVWSDAGKKRVVKFTIFTTEEIKKNDISTERREYHDISFIRLQTEHDMPLAKGQLVYVQGKIKTHHLFDAQNVKHYKTEIIASSVEILTNAI